MQAPRLTATRAQRLLSQPAVYNPLWVVGVLLDVFATLAGAGGKQLLRHAAVTGNNWWYPVGLVLTAVIDPAFDIAAYNFAAQSIIAPCAGLVIVWNLLLAPYTLKERLTRSRATAAFLVIVGTTGIGLFGNHSSVVYTAKDYRVLFARPAALGYYACFALWTAVLLYLAKLSHRARRNNGFVRWFAVGAFAGSIAGNQFTTKAAVSMLNCALTADPDCGPNPFLTPYPYACITVSLVLNAGALYLLAIALRHFEALYMITVYEGFMIISGSVSGNIVMDEMAGQAWWQLMMYGVSLCTILVGMTVLCRGETAMLAAPAAYERTALNSGVAKTEKTGASV